MPTTIVRIVVSEEIWSILGPITKEILVLDILNEVRTHLDLNIEDTSTSAVGGFIPVGASSLLIEIQLAPEDRHRLHLGLHEKALTIARCVADAETMPKPLKRVRVVIVNNGVDSVKASISTISD